MTDAERSTALAAHGISFRLAGTWTGVQRALGRLVAPCRCDTREPPRVVGDCWRGHMRLACGSCDRRWTRIVCR